MAESMWRKLNDRIKMYGFATLISRVAKRGLSRIGFQKEVFFYCAFDLQNPFKERDLPEGYSSRVITLEDVLHHSAIPFTVSKLDVFRKRLSTEGYSGIGIFHQNRMVGCAWLSLNIIEVPFPSPENDSLKLSPEEGYLLDAFSHPEHRGKGFHPFYTWWRYDAIKKSGRRYAVTIIDEDNRSARTAQAKSGFSIKKKFVVKKAFGKIRVHSVPSNEQL
jgi:hypothetical protein